MTIGRHTLCLSDVLASALARHGDRTAIKTDDRQVSYAELDRASDALAASLQRHGIGRGDRVALHLRNCIEYVVAEFAILKLCAVKVPLNELMAPSEITYCLDHAQARALIRHASLPEASELVDSIQLTLCAPEDEFEPQGRDWLASLADYTGGFVRNAPHADDMAVLAYTGGTTGRPKGVVHIQSTLAINLFAHVVSGDIRSDEVMLLTTPLPHSAGFHLLACLLQGGQAVIARRFEPESFVRLTLEHGATWTFAVPTMIYRLLDHLKANPAELPSLRTFVYGAAPMSLERLQEGLAVFGPVFLQIYGQTECPNFVTTLTKRDHLDPALLTSCGRPVPFLTIDLIGPDGRQTPNGSVGEIQIRSPYNLVEYYRDPTATADALIEGALRTGDLAVRDERGYLFLVDRAKDMIITGGMNVYSVEVERALRDHPAIREAAVVGLPDPDWGERVTAAVTANEPLDIAAVQAFVRARLSAYKSPKSIVEIGAMPLTPYGKVDKKALRTILAALP